MKNYGHFEKELASYTLTEFPKVGNYEYIYKNDEILVKVDQYGISVCQINPPVGIAILKRETREQFSPIKVYFELKGEIYNNFDGFSASKVKIEYKPEKAIYTLNFKEISVITELFVPTADMRFVMNVSFVNNTNKEQNIKIMPTVFTYVNDLMMALWDKPEWYTKTEYNGKYFLTTRYSIAGKKEERRFFSFATNINYDDTELSLERLISATNNFNKIPSKFSGETENQVYGYSQCQAGISTVKLNGKESKTVNNVYAVSTKIEDVEKAVEKSRSYFLQENRRKEEDELKGKYSELFNIKKVKTGDENFNRFINGFLPLELQWVSALDRGWPTGMRGVRDASNDFSGVFAYNIKECEKVIKTIFSKQRSDGWYPRQIPFGDSDKFDLRQFVDSACFFTEYVYDYLAYTDDYFVLNEEYPYYDSELKEDGLTHLIKGMEYLMAKENIGEHGLVKSRGGDWLDCLNSAGLKGRGETVMVSCQMVMCLKNLAEILKKLGKSGTQKYLDFAETLKENINKYSYNKQGFYNGVFTDRGTWIFSDKDEDGIKRVYAPTNAYAIISGVAKGKEQKIIENLETLKTSNGYKLFSEPFGVKAIDGIGKMGSGDFLPYFCENASVYNHGSQFFYVRALAEVGDYEKLYTVLNYAMPFNEEMHPEKSICSAPYAITNCYLLVPSFYGRSCFSFLTGSVAMLERSIYNWMFGLNWTLDNFVLQPCVPKKYKDSTVWFSYCDKNIEICYLGFGRRIVKATADNNELEVKDGIIKIVKDALTMRKIVVELENYSVR